MVGRRDRLLLLNLLALAAAALLLSWAGGVTPPGGGGTPGSFRPPWTPPPEASFVVVGDTGMGDKRQRAVADSMAAVCASRGCDLVIMTGDNFYMSGVGSVDDEQWRTAFEEPYAALDVPFHPVLGDHDYNGPPPGEPFHRYHIQRAAAQVAYTEVDEDQPRWIMPGRWYDVSAGGAARFFMLDAHPIHRHVAGDAYAAATTDAQHRWLDVNLDEAPEPWRFVVGHYPYVTNGERGDIDGPFAAFIEEQVCDRAHVYFAGDDHTLQWLAPVEECGGTHFIISGAGSAPRSLGEDRPHEALFQEEDVLGFWWVRVEGDVLTAAAYGTDAALLFEGTLERW